MKLLSKIFLVFYLCLAFSCVPAISKSPSITTNVQVTEFSYEYYSSLLSTGLFPEIKDVLKKYHKYLTKEEVSEAMGELQVVVKRFFIERKVLVEIPRFRITVYESSDKKVTVFNLELTILFLDKEETNEPFVNTITISKSFLIFMGKAKAGAGI